MNAIDSRLMMTDETHDFFSHISAFIASRAPDLMTEFEAQVDLWRTTYSVETRDERQERDSFLADASQKAFDAIVQNCNGLNVLFQEVIGTNVNFYEEAEKMNETLGGLSSDVDTLASAAEEMTASAKSIEEQISESSGAAKTSLDRSDDLARGLEGLTTATSEITQFIDIIKTIASQTNLLALNATIEAARAGDAGRGFAVVASEVKTLAKNSSDAAERVEAQIKSMVEAVTALNRALEMVRSSAREAETLSNESQGLVQQQSTVVVEVTATLTGFASRLREVTSHNQSTQSLIEETLGKLEQVVSDMEVIEMRASQVMS